MIVKKLLARFINDKIIQNAEHIYIATASISEAGFDLVMSRISGTCHVDILTGLDRPVSPEVLRRILKQYHNRVALRIYPRNFFHANLYMFDMPYRRQVAFIGSGQFTQEGFADNEELSYRVTTEKELEEISSWFVRNFEESIELTEKVIEAYEPVYLQAAERDRVGRDEKKHWIDMMNGKA